VALLYRYSLTTASEKALAILYFIDSCGGAYADSSTRARDVDRIYTVLLQTSTGFNNA
jgi:hypothetical protein